MNRGLMKTTGLYALTLAAGFALSASANAADLGGNCCADLEERVAELEATTARKGNRKVSLTISGQVNRTMMYWDDGGRSNTYLGIDNANTSTRFGFSGNAKINAEWSAGFNILIDMRDKARSNLVNQQTSEEGSSQERSGNQNGDHLLRVRAANWYLQSERLGKFTVGRLTTSGPTGTIDLGGVSVVATAGEGCIGDGLKFRDAAGNLTNASIDTYSMACANPGAREEGIQWTSPTLHGFSVSASLTEAAKVERPTENGVYNASTGGGSVGRNVGVDLRYAGEFNGVRAAASVGWQSSKGNDDDSGFNNNSNFEMWGLAGSLLHVPTGLFVQAEYISAEIQYADNAVAGSPLLAGTREADRWHIQAGLRRNFFGIGDTSIYGEYGKHNDWGALNTAAAGVAAGTGAAANLIAVAPFTADSLKIWGVGVVQNVDAAAMELYLGYRNYEASMNNAVALKDISVLAAGARIKF